MTEKWDKRFLAIAKEVSTWSKDPSSKIGAVIVKDRIILSTGYNGFPRGIPDDKHYYENKEFKYDHIVHAEENAILNYSRTSGSGLEGSTIYVYGLPLCHRCCTSVIQSGIKRIVLCKQSIDQNVNSENWQKSWNITINMCTFANIEISII